MGLLDPFSDYHSESSEQNSRDSLRLIPDAQQTRQFKQFKESRWNSKSQTCKNFKLSNFCCHLHTTHTHRHTRRTHVGTPKVKLAKTSNCQTSAVTTHTHTHTHTPHTHV